MFLKKYSKIILFFSAIIFTASAFSQKENKSTTEDFLDNNPYLHGLKVEKFFLHTNKSTYYAGEKVWFKAYVVNDADNKPSLETTNLHINLYNTKKELISNQLFLVKDGTTHGEIELQKELSSGKYYIELTTQLNQNFDNNASITSIEVLNLTNNSVDTQLTDNASQSETIAVEKESLDIQFFPDSSDLLEDAINSISFTATANSNSIKITGDIIDNTTNIVVAKLETNNFGMGSFKLYYRPERTYSAKINYNNEVKTIQLPKASSIGILIEENTGLKNDTSIGFTIKTNINTLSTNNRKTLFAVLHRNGFTKTVVPIPLNRKSLNYSFNILKSNLFDGVNIITVFNNTNEPISEYTFFNQIKEKEFLDVTKLYKEKDSITLGFNIKNGLKNANISISILPTNTKMYHKQSSILTSFLLAPYLEKVHVNLNEYFESSNAEDDIDFLLKISAKKNSLSYKKNIREVLLPENGLIIKGNVSSNVKDLTNYKVLLSSEENNILLIDSIGTSNSFSFNNLILKHPSNYKLALLDQQGKIIKTGFRITHEKLQYKPNQLLEKEAVLLNKVNSTKKNEDFDIFDSSPPLLIDDSTLLDVVNVKGKNKNSYQEKEEKLKKLGIKKSVLENGFAQLHIIEKDKEAYSIADYLNRIPGIKVLMNNPPRFSIINSRGKSSLLGNAPMQILVDGIISDTEYLESMRASDFSAISVNLSGAGAGARGQGGFINLYTKNGKYSEYKSTVNKDIKISETEFGFSIGSNYEKSQLIFSDKLSKELYSTIDWFPNFNINTNSTNKIKFNTEGFEDVKVIINGMDTDGNLIFKIAEFSSK